MHRFVRWITFLVVLPACTYAQRDFNLPSPGGIVVLHISNAVDGTLSYSLAYRNKQVIKPSLLGLQLSKPLVTLNHFEIEAIDTTRHDDTWQPVWGEVNHIRNHYAQLAASVKENSGIRLTIVFRVFDDGLGFRYEFPQQPSLHHFVVAGEQTQFAMTGDHTAFWIPGDFDSNEYLYNMTPLSAIDAVAAAQKEKDIAVTSVFDPNGVQTPLMMKSADHLYINIHEAALINYPAMNLILDKKTLTFTSRLVPDAVGNMAYLETPARTPWRTVIVSDKATDMLTSKTILNLNEPSVFNDTGWIKPQKYVGVWWEMHIGKATWQKEGGKHGATTENVKRYIDFAAAHHLDGVLVEGWNQGWEDWFGNWKESVFDFVTPYPDYDVRELTRYAKLKGVRIIMHHETSGSATNYDQWMDSAYRFMKHYDMNTVKTGYVGRIIPRGEHHDGQWMINHYDRVARKTAAQHIMLVAHEPVRPTGLHRTYPNWLANEAARGTEFNNAPALGIPPEHTTILPFTRLMGGPMDFTPGIFHLQLNQFVPVRIQRVRTTLAKQLALYITIYSPVQMAADLPENYENHLDAFKWIEDVPVDWDDTRVLEAEPGDFITIVRKAKGKPDWYLGAITDENPRKLSLKLDFLDPGKSYEATIYRDAENSSWEKNAESYVIEHRLVTNKSKLEIPLAAGGGCAVSMVRK